MYVNPRQYRSPGFKTIEAENKYHWWLEVWVFVREAEGVHKQSRVELKRCMSIERRWNRNEVSRMTDE